MTKCYFFGCWNKTGHFLHGINGGSIYNDSIVLFGTIDKHKKHLDGTLAPRKNRRTKKLCWTAQAMNDNEYHQLNYDSDEYPQGQFLRHVLDNGFTAIQWWDRCQGDDRGAYNSTVLLEGEHTTEEMLEALRVNFPHVLENLKRNGIELSEITLPIESE